MHVFHLLQIQYGEIITNRQITSMGTKFNIIYILTFFTPKSLMRVLTMHI